MVISFAGLVAVTLAPLLTLLAGDPAALAPSGSGGARAEGEPVEDGNGVTRRLFRTEVEPRVDPVFGGVAALRTALDEFLSLEGDMKRARDGFSDAVHDALTQVGSIAIAPPGSGPRGCPPAALEAQRKARDSGRRFLALGRRFEARFREIRRALGAGDTVGLTPDYRLKANRARELYSELLRDYQEMRAAFHDQLGAELRNAGCKSELGPAPPPASPAAEPPPPDPDNNADWSLAAADDPLPPITAAPARTRAAANDASPESGPAIWIEIDNTRCARPSALTLDGRAITSIPGGKKVQIRTRAGPHALCVLPSSDKRTCGATGTVRRAYLFEGWSMAVRCEK